MATFTIGDYKYTTLNNTVKAETVYKGQTSYADIPRTVTYNGKTYTVTYLNSCFRGCTALTTAPTIPNSVTEMGSCFFGCTALTTAPTIPNSVTEMGSCFFGCTSLTTAPTIPNSVTTLYACFEGCTALTTAPTIPNSVTELSYCFHDCSALQGNSVINANAQSFNGLFRGTQKGIWLTGTSTKLAEIAATANNNNVFVGEIPLSYSLDIERVAGDGGTVQDPEGLWAHVQLTINWTDLTDNSIDAITLTNGTASTSPTWYTDAAKTSAISLPNWRPSASTTIHCWLAITSATHVFSVTVADHYHTGVVISFTVPQQFRTMDFLAGGQGVAFGMPATQAGMFINMDVNLLKALNFDLEYSGTPPNATGRDADLINAIYKLGWQNDIANMLIAKTLLAKILNKLFYMDCGTIQAPSIAANSQQDVTITFSKTFASTPRVIACFESTSTAYGFGRVTCGVHSITATGCKVRIFNADSAARSPAIQWFAIMP